MTKAVTLSVTSVPAHTHNRCAPRRNGGGVIWACPPVRLVCLLIPAGLLCADSAVPVSSPRLAYATYASKLPGTAVYGLAVDLAGNAYVPGGGPDCAFINKLNQTGTAAVSSACLPMFRANAVRLDAAGYVYVAGDNQPHTSGFVNAATVMKLSPDGQQVVYSTSIPGAFAAKLALDRAGSAYVLIVSDGTAKATPGAYLTTGGPLMAVKLNASGTVEYATYLDMFAKFQYPDRTGGIAVDSKGQAWVVAAACPGPFVGTQCNTDIVGTASAIRKLDATGSHLLVSNNFGGGPRGLQGYPQNDSAFAVAVDQTDSAWIVGEAESSGVPTTPKAIEPQRPPTHSPPGSGVGYAVKLSPSGDILYGTYIGGNTQHNDDRVIVSVATDGPGDPYFALNFTDSATVMALSADGSRVLTTANSAGPVQAIALDGNGGLYVAGSIGPVLLTTAGAYQPLYPGGSVAGFVAKFDLATSAPAATLEALFNAAGLGNTFGIPAPGEIMTIFGKNLPPNPNVTFDGVKPPILYADANQINFVIPFEVHPPLTVISIEGIGAYNLLVRSAVPALFTADGSGNGQLAALNQDGTINSSANPAKPGSVVAVYMTGLGAMTPPIADGQLGPLQPPFPTPFLGVSALMNNSPGLANGIPAPILFVGQAPGLIAGAVQVNLQIPAGVPSGDLQLTIYVDGGYQTQLGQTTIAVQQ